MRNIKEEMIVEDWVESLTIDQLRKALCVCVNELVLTETLCISDDGKPYWDCTGDRLI